MIARQREIHQRRMAGKIGFLLEEDDACVRLDLANALIGLDAVIDQLEQRRFAGAVASYQGEPVTRADMKVDVLAVRTAQQPAPALLQAKAFPGEDRRLRHSRAQVSARALGRKP